ncbi:MAG: hypothetical protein K9J17_15975 [Flavobacteriales bacterium]|nr:hypothetical protein [Flavobacteriales bacterium]
MEFWNIIIAVGILLLLSLSGLFVKSKDFSLSFLLGERSLSWKDIAFSMAAGVVGGGILLTYSAYAYQYGISAYFIFIGIALGVLMLLWVTKKYKKLIDEQELITLPELFRHLYGVRASKLSSYIVLGWSFGFICMQLVAAGVLLEGMIGLPYWLCIVFAAGLVLLYLLKNGFAAVVKTDFIQLVALLIFFTLLTASVLVSSSAREAITTLSFESMKIEEIIGFVLLGMLNIIVSADLWQRIYAAKSTGAANKGIIVAFVLVLFAGLVLITPTLMIKTLGVEIDPNMALMGGIKSIIGHSALLGVAFAAVLSAVISALDTMIFVAGVSLSNDISIRLMGGPISDRVKGTKFWMVVVTIVACVLSVQFRSLLDIGLAISSLGLSLVPAVIMGLFIKDGKIKRSATVVYSLRFGLIGFFGLIVSSLVFDGDILTPVNSLVTLPCSIVGAVYGHFYGRENE